MKKIVYSINKDMLDGIDNTILIDETDKHQEHIIGNEYNIRLMILAKLITIDSIEDIENIKEEENNL